MQAKDYEMDPLWKPEMSRAGSKAAVLAQRDFKSPDAIYTPAKAGYGSSAAGIAHDNNFSPAAITQRDTSASDHKKALMAATGAMAGSRRRAGSAPTKPPADKNSKWALQAATSSHRTQTPPTEFTTGDPGFEASRIQNMAKGNVNRQMYGSKPPVAIEVEERNRQDMLKASAIAMARKMYAIQQSHIDEARASKSGDNLAGARAARNRGNSDASESVIAAAPNRYENLEEAARKLAQERLAKLHDEHAEYRQYYGASPTSPPKSRLSGLSLRNRRNRASTRDGDSDDSDEEQSRRIKTQMSIFQSKLAEVDNKKRQADRDALLEAAHKNVTKQMNAMDEKVFKDTGKTSPQQRELWERQARERAQRDSDERMINVGKVHIGGGKYMDQSEIDAIARARLQPTLDDITEKAEKQRAHDEEVRLEQERQKEAAEKEKQRQSEIQQGIKRDQRKYRNSISSSYTNSNAEQVKDEERARRAEEKRVQKGETAATKEKARLEKEEKRKSKDNKPGRFAGILGKSGTAAAGSVGVATEATVAAAEAAARPGTADAEHGAVEAADHAEVKSAEIPPSPEGLPSVYTQVTSPASPMSPVPPESPKEDFNPVYHQVTSTSGPTSPGPPESPKEDFKDAPTSPETSDGVTSPISTKEEVTAPISAKDEVTSPTSPKGDSKVKSWFKSRFRSTSKTENDPAPRSNVSESTPPVITTKIGDEEDKPRSDSMRDVAMAGRKDTESEDLYGDSNEAPVSPVKDATEPEAAARRSRSTSISSMSSYDDESPGAAPKQAESAEEPKPSTEEPSKLTKETPSRVSTERPSSENLSDSEPRGRKGFRQRLLSKVKRDKKDKDQSKTIQEEPTIEQQAASMPDSTPMHEQVTTSAGKDEGEGAGEDDEARDTFAEEKLAPPPKLPEFGKGGSPKGSRERSKFKEEL